MSCAATCSRAWLLASFAKKPPRIDPFFFLAEPEACIRARDAILVDVRPEPENIGVLAPLVEAGSSDGEAVPMLASSSFEWSTLLASKAGPFLASSKSTALRYESLGM